MEKERLSSAAIWKSAEFGIKTYWSVPLNVKELVGAAFMSIILIKTPTNVSNNFFIILFLVFYISNYRRAIV